MADFFLGFKMKLHQPIFVDLCVLVIHHQGFEILLTTEDIGSGGNDDESTDFYLP